MSKSLKLAATAAALVAALPAVAQQAPWKATGWFAPVP